MAGQLVNKKSETTWKWLWANGGSILPFAFKSQKNHPEIQSRLLFPSHDFNWPLHSSLSPLTKRNSQLTNLQKW